MSPVLAALARLNDPHYPLPKERPGHSLPISQGARIRLYKQANKVRRNIPRPCVDCMENFVPTRVSIIRCPACRNA